MSSDPLASVDFILVGWEDSQTACILEGWWRAGGLLKDWGWNSVPKEKQNPEDVVFKQRNRQPHADLGQNSPSSNEGRLACNFHFQMYTEARRWHGIVQNRKKKVVSLFLLLQSCSP